MEDAALIRTLRYVAKQKRKHARGREQVTKLAELLEEAANKLELAIDAIEVKD